MTDPANCFSVLTNLDPDDDDALASTETAAEPEKVTSMPNTAAALSEEEPTFPAISFCYRNVFYDECHGDAWCLRLHVADTKKAIKARAFITEAIFKKYGACATAMRAFSRKGPACKHHPWKCGAHPQNRSQYERWRAVFIAHQRAYVQCPYQMSEDGCDYGIKCLYKHIQDQDELAAAQKEAAVA